MQFRLTYDGPLPSRGGIAQRQRIREHLHPQLAELWGREPLSAHADKMLRLDSNYSVLTMLGGQCFASIVSEATGLGVELDILLLRRQHPRAPIVVGGDIDNRIKTLLDGLRCPAVGCRSAGRRAGARTGAAGSPALP